MKVLKTIHILLIISLAWNFNTFGQFQLSDLTKPDKTNISGDSLKKMEKYFHKLVDEKKLAGIQAAILRNGKLIYFDNYGYLNVENQVPISENSIFRIFSMTKPIVSVALMQLYEEGKFKLNDPVHKHIPEFKKLFILKDSTLVPFR